MEASQNSDTSTIDKYNRVRLASFVQEISISGIKYVVVAKSYFRKLVWLCLVLAASCFSCYQIYQRCAYFASRPLSTRIYTNGTEELPFPVVTVCSDNKVTWTQLENIGGYELVKNFKFVYPFFDSKPEEIAHFWNNATNWTDVYYSNSSFELDAFVWNGRHSRSNHKFVSTELGVCLQLNSLDDNFTSHIPGPEHGMMFVLGFDDSEFVAMDYTTVAVGFRIALHQAENVPLMRQNGIRVGRGVQTSIAIKAHKTTYPGLPYINCSEDPSYSFSNCMQMCMTNFFVSACNCKQLHMEGTHPVCSLEQEYYCGRNASAKFTSKDMARNCGCLKPCFEVHYSYSMSFATMSDFILKSAGIDEKAYNFAAVNLFYSEIAYEELVTVPAYTPLALLCDIGGALGLFLGSTFLTILEILEFTFIELAAYFGRKNNVIACK